MGRVQKRGGHWSCWRSSTTLSRSVWTPISIGLPLGTGGSGTPCPFPSLRIIAMNERWGLGATARRRRRWRPRIRRCYRRREQRGGGGVMSFLTNNECFIQSKSSETWRTWRRNLKFLQSAPSPILIGPSRVPQLSSAIAWISRSLLPLQ